MQEVKIDLIHYQYQYKENIRGFESKPVKGLKEGLAVCR